MIQEDSQMHHLFAECRNKTPDIIVNTLYFRLFFYPLKHLSAFERVYFRVPE